MVAKIVPFIAGMGIGNLIVLNHIYENELLKQKIRDEVSTLKKVRDFVSSSIIVNECIETRLTLGIQG